MTNLKELQERINLVRAHKEGIVFTVEELIHEQYRRGAFWMKLDSLQFYAGNNVTLQEKVNKYLSNYSPDLFRPIEVCLIDGEWHIEGNTIIVDSGIPIIINGHHRKSMFVILGMPMIHVVFRDDIKTEEDLIDYYLRLNASLKEEKKSLQNMHMNASLIKGSDDEYIDNVNQKYNLSFAEFKADNSLRCVEACRDIVKRNGRFNYDTTIHVLVDAFDGDPNSLTAVIVRNISSHLKENEGLIEFHGWLDLYILHLKSRPAVEWNERWTPKKSKRLARADLKDLAKRVSDDLGNNPRSYKKRSNTK